MSITDKIKTLNFGSSVIGTLEQALKAWETYIATRQQAYERHMDKRKEKAIQTAEESFSMIRDVFEYIYEQGLLTDDKGFHKMKVNLYKKMTKFNKYD